VQPPKNSVTSGGTSCLHLLLLCCRRNDKLWGFLDALRGSQLYAMFIQERLQIAAAERARSTSSERARGGPGAGGSTLRERSFDASLSVLPPSEAVSSCAHGSDRSRTVSSTELQLDLHLDDPWEKRLDKCELDQVLEEICMC
jgi:hypothetical protein